MPQLHKNTDVDIERSAETALQVTAYLLKNSVKARVQGGRVILSGAVEWDYQRQTALSAVRYLPGVMGVSDEIKVKPLASIVVGRAEIEAARNRHARTEALRISGKVRA